MILTKCNIMAEGFRFMPLGLVRLRTLHGLLRCNINTGVHACTHGADVSLRDHTIVQMGNGVTECRWCHALEARGGFWGFWKSQVVELSPASGEDGWLLLAHQSQAQGLGQVSHEMGGADEKARIERMCISLLMSKNL